MIYKRLFYILFFSLLIFIYIYELGLIHNPKSTHSNKGFHSNNQPLILAHRGSRSLYPENTLGAYEIALLWADVIEFDVRLTADNNLVLFHDENLERTTNGKGLVRDYTTKQLKELDAGYKFSPFSLDPIFSSITDKKIKYPMRGKNIKIPTLDEYLEKFRGVKTNIEIKDKDEIVAHLLYKKLQPYLDKPNLFVISSKRIKSLNTIRKLTNYTVATSICEDEVVPFTVTTELLLNKLYHTFFPLKSSIHQIPTKVGISLSTPQYIKNAHDMGNHVHYWVVNTEDEITRLATLGVDGIITDRADLARKVFNSINFSKKNESLSDCEDKYYRLEGEEDNILMRQRRNCLGKVFYIPKADFIETFTCNSLLCKYFPVIFKIIIYLFYSLLLYLAYSFFKSFFQQSNPKSQSKNKKD